LEAAEEEIAALRADLHAATASRLALETARRAVCEEHEALYRQWEGLAAEQAAWTSLQHSHRVAMEENRFLRAADEAADDEKGVRPSPPISCASPPK